MGPIYYRRYKYPISADKAALCLFMLYKLSLLSFLSIQCLLLVGSGYSGHAQKNNTQSFTLASGSFNPSITNAIEYDWRLDLGTNTIGYHSTKGIHLTSGFLQPNLYRFKELHAWKANISAIHLRYMPNQQAVILYSTAPDLTIHGFHLFNSKGQLLQKNQVKTASSFLTKSIDLSFYANGVYYLLVYYLPDNINAVPFPPYWTKTLKLLKQ